MPTIYDDEGEERLSWREMDSKAKSIQKGDKEKRGSRGFEINLRSMVGICSNCENYVFIEDDLHQIIFSACKGINWENPIPMVKRKTIRNCSEFSRKGQLSLQAMFGIATLIDASKDKQIKGFVPTTTKKEKEDA